MIFDTVENIDTYRGLAPAIDSAIDYVKNTDLAALEDQRVTIDGDRVFAIIQSYDTEPQENKRFEAHRKYIDLQYLISGTEVIFQTQTTGLQDAVPYDVEKDIVFLEGDTAETAMVFVPGSFSLLFPQDAHKPGCNYGESGQVRKCVVKIAVD